MAVEKKRGCGYRKVGGLYLMGGILSAGCDRLPIVLKVCPICGQGVKVGKGFTKINPFKLWGNHEGSLEALVDDQPILAKCSDPKGCFACWPPDDVAFIMRVGDRHYTPKSFINEGMTMGVSKRIPFIPRELVVGKTVIYLVHKKAAFSQVNRRRKSGQHQMIDFHDGIFCAFIPQAIEMPVWESQLKGKGSKTLKDDAKKRGITLVPIPDSEKGGEHDPDAKKKKRGKKQ